MYGKKRTYIFLKKKKIGLAEKGQKKYTNKQIRCPYTQTQTVEKRSEHKQYNNNIKRLKKKQHKVIIVYDDYTRSE